MRQMRLSSNMVAKYLGLSPSLKIRGEVSKMSESWIQVQHGQPIVLVRGPSRAGKFDTISGEWQYFNAYNSWSWGGAT